jgi:hypothetical protein
VAFELTRGVFLEDLENWEEVEVEKRWRDYDDGGYLS